MKRALISHLHAIAKDRKPGYLEACLREGKPSPDGRWLLFPEAVHASLRQQYSSYASHAVPSPRRLGDLVHKLAGPIGRAVRWPCLKGDGTTNLKPGSPCARARRALNKWPVWPS
jgi:hypothetical protein